jgi:hypothetical protein
MAETLSIKLSVFEAQNGVAGSSPLSYAHLAPRCSENMLIQPDFINTHYVSLTGYEALRILYHSRRFEQLTDSTPTELLLPYACDQPPN